MCLVSCCFCPMTLRYNLELDMVIPPVLFLLLRLLWLSEVFLCVCFYVNFKVFLFSVGEKNHVEILFYLLMF